jgi:hypothetical protein
MQDRTNQVQTFGYRLIVSREGGIDRLPRVNSLRVLRCGVNGDLMEGRVHDV